MAAHRLSSEFKEKVVLEVILKGRTIAEVARPYDLVPQTVVNWVKKWRREHTEPEFGGDQATESRRLRAELREARMEIDFLKKRQPGSAGIPQSPPDAEGSRRP